MKKSVLERAKDFLENAKSYEAQNRESYLDDIRFSRLGEQWPEAIRRQREIESRPCLTFNKLPSFIRQTVNDSRQNKPRIKVIPVGSDSDKDVANAIEGLIRNIEIQSSSDIAYDTAIDCAVSGGYGYIRVRLDYAYEDNFDMDICIDAIPDPLTVYGDYNSKCADSRDWNQCLIESWITKDEFKQRYPGKEAVDFEFDFTGSEAWVNEDSVLIAEYWEREEYDETIYQLSNGNIVKEDFLQEHNDIMQMAGVTVVRSRPSKCYKVNQYTLSGDSEDPIDETEWPGQYIPVVPVYGEDFVVNGKRYLMSLHKHARGAQESYNYWRTSAVEKVALDTKAPWIGMRGFAKTDIEKWNTANIKNHAFIEYDGQSPPFRTPAGGVPAGDIQLALNAADDMKSIIGIYDASLGARSNETSGRAIMARQREGDVSTFHFIDNVSRAIRHLGKIIVDVIPKLYTTDRIIRILNEDGTPEHIQINKKFIKNGIEKIYDLTVGKYDVTVKSGPSYTTKREESADQMMQLIQSYPQAAPIIGDLIAKNLDWQGADEIADRLKSLIPQPAQQMKPEMHPEYQQLLQQLQQLNQIVQKGQQSMADLQKENDVMKLQLVNKQGELGIKQQELELKKAELAMNGAELSAELRIKQAELQARSQQSIELQQPEGEL